MAKSAFKEKEELRRSRLGLRVFIIVNIALVASSIDAVSTIIHPGALMERQTS